MWGRKRKPSDFRTEIETHIELEAARLRERGLREEEARSAARRAFGNVTNAEERFYEAGRWLWWDHLRADIRYGLRMLAKNPGFTAIAVLTLALGIGANTAIFTVFDAVLLRALPVAQPGRLVLLTDPNSYGTSYGEEDGTRDLLGYSEFEYLRDHNSVFSSIFAADSEVEIVPTRIGQAGKVPEGQADTAGVEMVSGDFFKTLGIQAIRGRVFDSQVDRVRGGAPITVISYAFWDRQFGRNPAVLGQTIELRQTPFTIIGVAPRGFFGQTVGESPDVWVPLTMQAAILPGRDMLSPVPAMQSEYIWLQSVARLKPGVTIQQAQANVSVLFQQSLEAQIGPGLTATERKRYLDQRIQLQPGALGAATVRDGMGNPLKILMGLVGLVLLIACANVANLLLARGSARQKEFAVRTAIGAGRARLVRQLLAESLLLAFAGAAAGAVLAHWASSLLVGLMPGETEEKALGLALDWRVLVFTLAVTVATALLFGLAPAWRAARVDVAEVMKSTTAAPAGRRARRRWGSAGRMLVVAQVATSVILLVAAGLFVHSLARLTKVSLGYNPEHLILFRVDTASAGYQGEAQAVFCRGMLGKLKMIPGVLGATFSSDGLFQGSDSRDPIAVEGYNPPGGATPHPRMDQIGPGYFRAVGIPILLGREIEASDSAPSQRVAVINQAFAQTFFPHTNPLGKTVRDTFPGNPGEMEVVGVAGNARIRSLREKITPRLYFPLLNGLWPERTISFEVRTAADPAGVSNAIRQAVEQTNQALLPVRIDTMPALVDRSLGGDRFIARLAGAFALVATLLTGIGLYGVLAYSVARRTRDIGIRMALGAAPGEILRHMLREALILVVIGIAIGVPAAIAGTQLIRSLLFGLGPVDPAALVFAAALLAVVAGLAGVVPALRAARVDPLAAVRFE